MVLICLSLLFSLTIVDFSLCQWSTDGNTKTLNFVTSTVVTYSQINWIFQNGSTNFTLFQCVSFNQMCTANDDKTLDLYSANITSNSTSYISVLTIKNVSLSLHNTRWFCNYNTQNNVIESARYDLQVFAPAENPFCDEVKLLNGSHIQIHCGTNIVFPESICIFTVKTNVLPESEINQIYISYSHIQNLTTLYFKTTCTLVVSADILGPGSQMFRVVMYPNITSNITEEIKRTSQFTMPIEIDFPKAVLASDCQVDKYIKENRNNTCTCLNNSTSILPSQVIWSNEGLIIISKEQIEFTARRPTSTQNIFTCTISNDLNWKDQKRYQPSVAYGPDSVNLMVYNQNIEKCDSNNVNIIGTCTVSDSNPFPAVFIVVNNSWIQLKPGTVKNEYKFNVSVNSIGVVNVLCYANNSVFGDIFAQMNQYIQIKGATINSHMFIITNNVKIIPSANVMTIYEGISTVFCTSLELPLYKNISLHCLDFQSSTTNEDSAYLILNTSKETGTINCSCDVLSESRCPKNTIFVILKIIHNQSDGVKETNGVFIGLGVTTSIAVLTLLAFTIVFIFFRRRKPKMVQDSRAIEISEDYSKFEETHLDKEKCLYENTELKKKSFDAASDKIMEFAIPKEHLSDNTLGGFIGVNKVKENTPKNEDHPYEEVTDDIEQ